MADIICVVGNKGGTGKTTLTHLLGHGLSLLGHASTCIFTDKRGRSGGTSVRGYDCHHTNGIDDTISSILNLRRRETGLGIVDGGSGLNTAGSMLYSLADLTLIPFRDSSEDVRSVLRDLPEYPRAYLLPCQWPTNSWQQRSADRLIEESLGHCRDRLLAPVFACSATKLLLQEQLPEAFPSIVNTLSRDLAKQVVALLNISPKGGMAGKLRMAAGSRIPVAA